MNDFRVSIHNLRLFGMNALRKRSAFEDLPHIKKIEQCFEQKSIQNLASSPSHASLKTLLNKLIMSEEISSYEKKNIPFVLYDDKCVKSIFVRAISMLDISRISNVKRLFLVYLMQYDDKNYKTEYLARILQRIFEKTPFQTKNKLLLSGMNNTKILFGSERMRCVAVLIAKLKNIEGVLDILAIPQMFKDCKFIIAALSQYFRTKDYSLDDQYSLFESIRNLNSIEGYQSLFPLIADALIPKIENSRSTRKNEYKKSAIDSFNKVLGDPRFGYKSVRWNSVSNQSREIFLHWIVEKDLDLFFKIIEETAVDDMWSYRKEFWEKYLPYISKSWVYFGKDAQKYVRRISGNGTKYGELGKGCLPNHSVFAFQIDKFVFVEWSHNGKLRVWLEEDAPNVFYNNELEKYAVTGTFPLQEWVHAGKTSYGWQRRVESWIQNNCNLN